MPPRSLPGWRQDYYVFGGPPTFVVKWILLSLTAIWILLQVPAIARPVLTWCLLDSDRVLHGQVWRLVSHLPLTSGIFDLVFTLLQFYMFGCDMERVWGARRFLRFCLVAGAINAVVIVVGDAILGVPGGFYGPDAAILGLLVAWAVKFPDRQLGLFPLPVMFSARVFVALFIGVDLLMLWAAGFGAFAIVGGLASAAYGYVHQKRPQRLGRFRLPSLNPFAAYRRWQNRRIARKFHVLVNDLDPEAFVRRDDDDRRKLVN